MAEHPSTSVHEPDSLQLLEKRLSGNQQQRWVPPSLGKREAGGASDMEEEKPRPTTCLPIGLSQRATTHSQIAYEDWQVQQRSVYTIPYRAMAASSFLPWRTCSITGPAACAPQDNTDCAYACYTWRNMKNNIIDILALGASHVVHGTKIQRLLLANNDTQESTEA